jgi:N-acetylglucosaminyl-diphospho-decaprenol L-rhamnosyltransferase
MGSKTGCVILNYNDADTTKSLAEKIKDYLSIDSIVIVDNESTDGSYNSLATLAGGKIHVIKSGKNGGYGFGNNVGVEFAYKQLGCEYVLIANPDVIFSADTVANMVKVISSDDLIGVIAPRQLDINGNTIRDVAWKIPTIFQYIVSAEYFIGKYSLQFHYPATLFHEEKPYTVDAVPGSLLLVRGKAFCSSGGYDPEMFLYCEETTLAKKMKDLHYSTILLNSETYIHHHSVSINRSIKSLYKQRRILLNSRFIFLRKYLNANKFQLFWAKIFFTISLIENSIIQFVKR